MNQFHLEARNEAIRSALAGVGSELTPAGDSRWRITLSNGAAHFVTATAIDDWLVLEADSSQMVRSPDALWNALVQNASLSGLAKIVLSNDGDRIRADLPLLEGAELGTRLSEACSGFEGAWPALGHHSPSEARSPEDAGRIDLKRLCSEAGWAFTERTAGKLVVELEVRESYYQAVLRPTGHGVHVSCEMAELDGLFEPSRLAIAGFLLAASGHVRMGRASVNMSAAPLVAQFEVLFGTPPSPSEISSALESLSVACSLCGEEIKSLRDPVVAERYLTLRGWDLITAVGLNERTAK